ncbi:MAG: hypothetical protein IJV22_02505 [Bacteroidales bacterium]|nr:hypothetical protein [Bacteroidales bacterium]
MPKQLRRSARSGTEEQDEALRQQGLGVFSNDTAITRERLGAVRHRASCSTVPTLPYLYIATPHAVVPPQCRTAPAPHAVGCGSWCRTASSLGANGRIQ